MTKHVRAAVRVFLTQDEHFAVLSSTDAAMPQQTYIPIGDVPLLIKELSKIRGPAKARAVTRPSPPH